MGRRTITCKGGYTWNLVFNLDNTGGSSSTYKRTVKVCTRVSRSDCLRALQRAECAQDMSSMAGMNMNTNGSCPFRLSMISASATMGYSFHQNCYNDMMKDTHKDVIVDSSEEVEEEYTIPAGARMRLYQLCFSGPGVEMRLPTLASNIEDIPPVMITAVVEEFSGPLPTGKYAIRTMHGKHLTAPPESGSQLMQQTHMKSWEKFTLVQAGGSDRYGIRSAHGTFLCAHPGTGESSKVDLQCDKHNWERMQWEQFTLVPVPNKDGCFGIRTIHGTFLCANPDGRMVLQHDMHDWDKMHWEQFCFVAVD